MQDQSQQNEIANYYKELITIYVYKSMLHI